MATGGRPTGRMRQAVSESPLTTERMDLLAAAGCLLQVARIMTNLGRSNMAATMRAYAEQINAELGITPATDYRFEHEDERRG